MTNWDFTNIGDSDNGAKKGVGRENVAERLTTKPSEKQDTCERQSILPPEADPPDGGIVLPPEEDPTSHSVLPPEEDPDSGSVLPPEADPPDSHGVLPLEGRRRA